MATLKEFILECIRSFDPSIDTSPGSPVETKVVDRIVKYIGGEPDLINFKQFSRIILAQKYPDIAREEGDPLTELILNPVEAIVEPVAREIANITKRQSLENLDYHTKESIDAAAGNLFLERIKGEYAYGTVRLYYSSPRYVAATTEKMFFTATGLNFFPVANQYITANQMAYNMEGDYYYFDVRVVSQLPGDQYNIGANSIAGALGFEGAIKVTNKTPFRGGAHEETNEELLSRALMTPNEVAPNTYRGIYALLRDNFPSITYLQLIGYGDPEMQRDLVTGGGYGSVYTKSNGEPAYTTNFTIEEDGDYDGLSPILRTTDLDFTKIFNTSTPSASLSLLYQDTLYYQQDINIKSVIDQNAIELEDEIPQSINNLTIKWILIRRKGLFINGLPEIAYQEVPVFQVSDKIHVGGCLDVWIRDPEPSEETTELTISDEKPFAEGICTFTSGDDKIYISDLSYVIIHEGMSQSTGSLQWVGLDLKQGGEMPPFALEPGLLIKLHFFDGLEDGYYYILHVDCESYVNGVKVAIWPVPSKGSSSYQVIDCGIITGTGIKPGWSISLSDTEPGIYKILKVKHLKSDTVQNKPVVEVTVDHTFSTSGSSPYKVFDKVKMNLYDPKKPKMDGEDLVCVLGDPVVRSASGIDFNSYGVEEGDTLRISEGVNAGDYEISKILEPSKLLLKEGLKGSGSNIEYSIFTKYSALNFPVLSIDKVTLNEEGGEIEIPYGKELACIGQGISNPGSGIKQRFSHCKVGLVGEGGAYPLTGDITLNLRLIRPLFNIPKSSSAYISITLNKDFYLSDVIDKINDAIGYEIAVDINGELGFRHFKDQAILIQDDTAANTLGFTSSNTCKVGNDFVSYSVFLSDNFTSTGDFIYFSNGINYGKIYRIKETYSVSGNIKGIILDPFIELIPESNNSENEVVIGYPSTGDVKVYFNAPTDALATEETEFSFESDEVSRTYRSDPDRYYLVAPRYTDTDRPIGYKISEDFLVPGEKFYMPVDWDYVKNIDLRRGDTIYFRYRNVWFKNNTKDQTFNIDGEWLQFAVNGGVIKKVVFTGSPLSAQSIINKINQAAGITIAVIDKDSTPGYEYICFFSQYLLDKMVASSGLIAALGDLVGGVSESSGMTNKSHNFDKTAIFIRMDQGFSSFNLTLSGSLSIEEEINLNPLGAKGKPKIQWEARRYGSQYISAREMAQNQESGLYYGVVDIISCGIGDFFNAPPDISLESSGLIVDGYTLTTHSGLSFSPSEPLEMDITPTIASSTGDGDLGSKIPVYGSAKICYKYSDTIGSVHDFLNDELNRVLSASVVARSMLPHFLSGTISYSGGATTDEMASAVKDLVDGLRLGKRLEISDIISLLANKGASYIQTPLVLVVEYQDENRVKKVAFIKDFREITRLAAYYVKSITFLKG
uniref:Baseplate protein J-like domain-containing protein n=1 Tax=Dictyoglomus turgidum TaxID=513050 RepID=A0A7C3WSK3_9BACT